MENTQRALRFTHKDYGHGILSITAPMGEQIQLVLGSERAAVIDTGTGIGSLQEYLRSLTDLPMIVINTHGHPDHAGGNHEFESCFMHPADASVFQAMCTKEFRTQDIRTILQKTQEDFEQALLPTPAIPLPVEDHDVICLGNRKLHIAQVSGHTKGSIALYDDLTSSIFAGDSYSTAAVWMYLNHSTTLETYYRSTCRLRDDFPACKQVFVGHIPDPLPSSVLTHAIDCVAKILSGEGVGHYTKTFVGEGLQYDGQDYSVIYNPDRLFEKDEHQ